MSQTKVMQTGQIAASLPRQGEDRVVFGQQWPADAYETIYQTVSLTPQQDKVARQIVRLTGEQDLQSLPTYLLLPTLPEYRPLVAVKGRRIFHTPFAQLFMNLAQSKPQGKLISQLMQGAPQVSNLIDELSDLYFFALRPGGEVDDTLKSHRKLQKQVLSGFEQLIQQPETARQTRNALRNRTYELMVYSSWRPQAVQAKDFEALQKHLFPILAKYVPVDPPRPTVPLPQVRQLETLLLNARFDELWDAHAKGGIRALIPDWGRVHGPDNIQHSTHDYPLDEHILRVVDGTKKSMYYPGLSATQKRLVTMAALLHDIQKNTGPANLRSLILPDRPHPLKSADNAVEILQSFGYPPDEIQTVYLLVLHHQMLGNMMMQNPGKPSDETLEQAAKLIGTPENLAMLKALTEGDIRGVKEQDGLFTADVAYKLQWFSDLIHDKLTAGIPLQTARSVSQVSADIILNLATTVLQHV